MAMPEPDVTETPVILRYSPPPPPPAAAACVLLGEAPPPPAPIPSTATVPELEGVQVPVPAPMQAITSGGPTTTVEHEGAAFAKDANRSPTRRTRRRIR